MERTLGIIKPDAVSAGHTGDIIAMYEKEGFSIAAMKLIHMDKKEAGGFYAVHRDKPFYDELTDFMSSGPCVVLALEADKVIERNRKLMGATDSKKADKGTIRNLYGTDIQNNAVHGSDSPESAAFEISYFFNFSEFVS